MHWSGKRMLWDRKNDVVELYGKAIVNKPGETLRADYIRLDLTKRTIDAVGNCRYTSLSTEINSEELHFNLDTGAGTIVNGQVTNGKFMLVGERINRLSPVRYQTHRAEYTTCHDCPSSWTMSGEDVDMEVEGYAYMSNVKAKIKDAPFLWFPYMILPVKRERQTGFLFPRFGIANNNGFVFVMPFFWAVGRSVDMTFGAGVYSARGKRFEWEGRYSVANGRGIARAFFFGDRFNDKRPTVKKNEVREWIPRSWRWAVDVQQEHELPFGIQQKFRFLEVSDIKYPVDVDDIEGRGEPVLTSQLIFSQASSFQSAYVEARRHRSLLNYEEPTQVDPRTVQLYPQAELTTNDRFLFGSPFSANITFGVSRFARTAGPFDYDPDSSVGDAFIPGQDPVREATRLYASPKLYTTLRPWDVISVIPSAEYKYFQYHFGPALPTLRRGYLQTQVDLVAQWERIYRWEDDPEVPATKHLMRPFFRYSRIPYINEPDHPFISQIRRRNGYNFDNGDIVPLSVSPSLANYFIPLGNSISIGATTQLIRKRIRNPGDPPNYERILEFSAGQTLNIAELSEKNETQIPFSRAFVTKEVLIDDFSWQSEYFFYPYLGRYTDALVPEPAPHEIRTSAQYIFAQSQALELFQFERSLTMSYTFRKLESRTHNLGMVGRYSINDFFQPEVAFSYNLVGRELLDVNARLTFQSPSRCYRLIGVVGNAVDRGLYSEFNLALNLTGDRFSSGFDDL